MGGQYFEGYRSGAVDYIYKPINPEIQVEAKVAYSSSCIKEYTIAGTEHDDCD
jgi:hypothetical protein